MNKCPFLFLPTRGRFNYNYLDMNFRNRWYLYFDGSQKITLFWSEEKQSLPMSAQSGSRICLRLNITFNNSWTVVGNSNGIQIANLIGIPWRIHIIVTFRWYKLSPTTRTEHSTITALHAEPFHNAILMKTMATVRVGAVTYIITNFIVV